MEGAYINKVILVMRVLRNSFPEQMMRFVRIAATDEVQVMLDTIELKRFPFGVFLSSSPQVLADQLLDEQRKL